MGRGRRLAIRLANKCSRSKGVEVFHNRQSLKG